MKRHLLMIAFSLQGMQNNEIILLKNDHNEVKDFFLGLPLSCKKRVIDYCDEGKMVEVFTYSPYSQKYARDKGVFLDNSSKKRRVGLEDWIHYLIERSPNRLKFLIAGEIIKNIPDQEQSQIQEELKTVIWDSFYPRSLFVKGSYGIPFDDLTNMSYFEKIFFPLKILNEIFQNYEFNGGQKIIKDAVAKLRTFEINPSLRRDMDKAIIRSYRGGFCQQLSNELKNNYNIDFACQNKSLIFSITPTTEQRIKEYIAQQITPLSVDRS
jgi:hypothetical protein